MQPYGSLAISGFRLGRSSSHNCGMSEHRGARYGDPTDTEVLQALLTEQLELRRHRRDRMSGLRQEAERGERRIRVLMAAITERGGVPNMSEGPFVVLD